MVILLHIVLVESFMEVYSHYLRTLSQN